MENAELVNMALVAANNAKTEGFKATQQAFESIIWSSMNLDEPKSLEETRPCSYLLAELHEG
jgi:flagellar basal body rod protein FlgG